MRFGKLVGNMARMRMQFKIRWQIYHLTFKFKVTLKGAFFKRSNHISRCICAIGAISVSTPTLSRSRITIMIYNE